LYVTLGFEANQFLSQTNFYRIRGYRDCHKIEDKTEDLWEKLPDTEREELELKFKHLKA
jgi:hypothetical protein